MNNDRLKGLLMLDKDVEFNGFYIKNYKLKEIFNDDFGLDKYYYLTAFARLGKQEIISQYKLNDTKDKSLYGIIWQESDMVYWLLDVLNTFTNLKWSVGNFSDFISYDENEKRIRFTEKTFDEFIILLKKIYFIRKIEPKIDMNKVIGEEAKKMAQEYLEETSTSDNKITILSIVDGICGKNLGYTYFNIMDLTVWKLMRLFYSIEQNESYNLKMNIISNGLYDGKKNGNTFVLHWANEIEVIK